ncbi:hypothetical protein [Enterococcus casseliflavus]|uniref:hypothetical protein n=1 Tax=Enterococcus casseliflavus TaxID=37734 RepID=UPI0039A629C3
MDQDHKETLFTKKEVQLTLSKLQVDFDKSEHVRNQRYRLEEVYHMWLEQHQNTDKPTLLENIEKCFKNQILLQIDSLNIEAINTHTCQKAVN